MAKQKFSNKKEARKEETAEEKQPTEAPKGTFHVCTAVYGLLVNDHVTPGTAEEPSKIDGSWFAAFMDLETGNMHGPYRLFDEYGQPLVGYVEESTLKSNARRTFRNKEDYAVELFPLKNSGMKLMSLLVWTIDPSQPVAK